MQQLSPPDSIVRSLIGNRIYQRGRHKLSQYVIMRKHDGSVLLYHTMTCELLLLSLDEWKAYKMNRELYNRCFLTEEEADEFAFAKKIKRLRQMVYKKYTKDHLHTPITRFWILTTTGCNARCFYCHEKGIPNMVMTEETADRVIEYILAQKKDQLRFMWYGGEPTMRSNIIHKIAQAVSDHGITFTSGMISNGYLFDEELAKEAKELWNLTDIQITLDGMEKTYNKVKDYIYRDSASPFVRVIKNIRHLLENEVLVRVRLNVDIYNMDEIDILINYLSDEFNGYDNFSIYIAPLMEDCLGTDYIREEKDRAAVFSFYKQTSSRLMSRGMLTKSDLPTVMKSEMRCIALSNVRVMYPNGQFAFCHDYFKGVLSGGLGDREPADEERLEYGKCLPDEQKCKSCTRYPQCVRLVKCFNNRCTKENVDEWIWNTGNEMVWKYENKKTAP